MTLSAVEMAVSVLSQWREHVSMTKHFFLLFGSHSLGGSEGLKHWFHHPPKGGTHVQLTYHPYPGYRRPAATILTMTWAVEDWYIEDVFEISLIQDDMISFTHRGVIFNSLKLVWLKISLIETQIQRYLDTYLQSIFNFAYCYPRYQTGSAKDHWSISDWI